MIAAIASLALLALCLLGALILREMAHDRERRELLDRIQAPETVQAAAFARAVPLPPPGPDTDAEDDARFGRPVEFDTFDPEFV